MLNYGLAIKYSKSSVGNYILRVLNIKKSGCGLN